MKKETRIYKIVIAIMALIIIIAGVMLYKIVNASDKNITFSTLKNNEDESVQIIISEADKLAQQNEIEKAIRKIEDGIELYPDNNMLKDKLSEYEYLNKTKIKNNALNDAETLVQNQGDYLGAVHLLEKTKSSIGEDFEDVNSKILEYKRYYISELIEIVNAEINDENFDEAEKQVKAALKELPAEQLLEEKLDDIANMRPQYLIDIMEPYDKPYHYKAFSGDFNTILMGGNEYKNGFTCLGYGDEDKGNLTYFNLQGKYSEISFTAGFVDGMSNFDDVVVTFRTIVDGNIVDSFDMKIGDLPVKRSIELPEGANQLIFSVDSHMITAMYDGEYGMADITVK